MDQKTLVKDILAVVDDFEAGYFEESEFDTDVDEMVFWIRELLDEWERLNG